MDKGWYPQSLSIGPPLPRSMKITWPWVKVAEEVAKTETPPAGVPVVVPPANVIVEVPGAPPPVYVTPPATTPISMPVVGQEPAPTPAPETVTVSSPAPTPAPAPAPTPTPAPAPAPTPTPAPAPAPVTNVPVSAPQPTDAATMYSNWTAHVEPAGVPQGTKERLWARGAPPNRTVSFRLRSRSGTTTTDLGSATSDGSGNLYFEFTAGYPKGEYELWLLDGGRIVYSVPLPNIFII